MAALTSGGLDRERKSTQSVPATTFGLSERSYGLNQLALRSAQAQKVHGTCLNATDPAYAYRLTPKGVQVRVAIFCSSTNGCADHLPTARFPPPVRTPQHPPKQPTRKAAYPPAPNKAIQNIVDLPRRPRDGATSCGWSPSLFNIPQARNLACETILDKVCLGPPSNNMLAVCAARPEGISLT